MAVSPVGPIPVDRTIPKPGQGMNTLAFGGVGTIGGLLAGDGLLAMAEGRKLSSGQEMALALGAVGVWIACTVGAALIGHHFGPTPIERHERDIQPSEWSKLPREVRLAAQQHGLSPALAVETLTADLLRRATASDTATSVDVSGTRTLGNNVTVDRLLRQADGAGDGPSDGTTTTAELHAMLGEYADDEVLVRPDMPPNARIDELYRFPSFIDRSGLDALQRDFGPLPGT